MKKLIALISFVFAGAAQAAPVTWVDWTSSTATGATGTLTVGAQTIDVSFSNTVNNNFVQTGGGINYWTSPTTYTTNNCTAGTRCADNAPPTSDIISLSSAGTRTITFSAPVENVYFTFVSWNGNVGTFSTPIELLSIGRGYWGAGTVGVTGNVMTALSGEPHGTLLLEGALSTFNFASNAEGWHGFTVGVGGTPAPGVIPLPAAGWLLISGFGALAGLRARRRAA